MGIKLNEESARGADNRNSIITESGKYVGTITRAEVLLSEQGTSGVGFSFKTDDGQTASYLDIYTEKNDGTELYGAKIVNAILACTKTRSADEGTITCEKWDKAQGKMVEKQVKGYPVLMGKRIGLLLQKELQTNDKGADADRIIIFGAFEAATGFTATEILDKATKPEKLEKMYADLLRKPVNDRRKGGGKQQAYNSRPSGDNYFDEDPGF